MKFSDYHHQREVQEMASFSVSGGFVVSCKNFTMYNLNCDDQRYTQSICALRTRGPTLTPTTP